MSLMLVVALAWLGASLLVMLCVGKFVRGTGTRVAEGNSVMDELVTDGPVDRAAGCAPRAATEQPANEQPAEGSSIPVARNGGEESPVPAHREHAELQ